MECSSFLNVLYSIFALALQSLLFTDIFVLTKMHLALAASKYVFRV